ncbi:threonine-phosphate decarboxylase CobD [Streptococcus catagoni]|uniref:threonine-phosphate decarboxylase CobD n=1 Tax=Streptococcus catagoni TaxID=2654874 RepID=UPI00140D24E1|nr:threonine-phosphate decarboxylase CobD [Streptococcus catagoni]
MEIEHGGNVQQLAKQLGINVQDCLDFSANINPYGLSPKLKKHLIDHLESLTQYPDIHYQKARNYLADYHGYSRDNVLLSNGAVEIFYQLADQLKPERLLTLSPTFMEYQKAFKQVGARISHLHLEAPHYQWDFQSLLSQLEDLQEGDVVLICNPNNPTGSLVNNKVLRKVANYLKEKAIFLILDEAFMDFIEDDEVYSFISYLADFPNVIVVRSLTKFYAIPGLRLGYAVTCHKTCLQDIAQKRAPWTINALSESAIPLLLSDEHYIAQTRQWLRKEQYFLYKAFTAISQISAVKPTANYLFFECQAPIDLRQALWQKKIFIRSCQNYDHLSEKHYRVAIRSHAENSLLVEAIKDILKVSGSHEKDSC